MILRRAQIGSRAPPDRIDARRLWDADRVAVVDDHGKYANADAVSRGDARAHPRADGGTDTHETRR